MTVLGPAALAFDAGECARLLELRQGRPPAESQVAMVMESTEGWPLGIALAALTAPGQEQLAARRSRADVFAFLAEEVVEQLAPGERAALIDSSVVRELSAEMVDALGLPPGFLATIERQGLFLRAVDPEHRRFRYHPLFREYLLGRFVAERDRDTAQAQHARAAAALAAAGDHAQAAEHWLAAGDHGAGAGRDGHRPRHAAARLTRRRRGGAGRPARRRSGKAGRRPAGGPAGLVGRPPCRSRPAAAARRDRIPRHRTSSSANGWPGWR